MTKNEMCVGVGGDACGHPHGLEGRRREINRDNNEKSLGALGLFFGNGTSIEVLRQPSAVIFNSHASDVSHLSTLRAAQMLFPAAKERFERSARVNKPGDAIQAFTFHEENVASNGLPE